MALLLGSFDSRLLSSPGPRTAHALSFPRRPTRSLRLPTVVYTSKHQISFGQALCGPDASRRLAVCPRALIRPLRAETPHDNILRPRARETVFDAPGKYRVGILRLVASARALAPRAVAFVEGCYEQWSTAMIPIPLDLRLAKILGGKFPVAPCKQSLSGKLLRLLVWERPSVVSNKPAVAPQGK